MYGEINHEMDASVLGIHHPNSNDAAFERFNPACMAPEILVQNTGTTNISSIKFEYNIEGGGVKTHFWTGSLASLDSVSIELPIDNFLFWQGTADVFHVNIEKVNGSEDDNPFNNQFSVTIQQTDVFDISETFVVECYTNNYGHQTSYMLTDSEGNILLEQDDLEDNTLYSDAMTLSPGCYKLQIHDDADDGLYWWHNSTQGSGTFRLKNDGGYVLEHFEPEFGRFAMYEFAVLNPTGQAEETKNRIASVYPNPTNKMVHIDLTGFGNESINFRMYDPSNRLVWSEESKISNDFQTKTVDISEFRPGIYFLKVVSVKGKFVFKVIKT